MNKISLFLMSEKGHTVLSGLIRESLSGLIESVILARDPNVERDFYAEIKQLCEEQKIPCFDKEEGFVIHSKYSFAVSWRWMLNTGNESIIFHDSLLPKYRGFSPLVNMLINGEKTIGVTAHFAASAYDSGGIILQRSLPVRYPLKISQAIKDIAVLYSDLAIEIAKAIRVNDRLPSIPQDEKKVSYSLWRDEDDYWIDWSASSARVKRFIDAVGHPYKGAMTTLEKKLVRILDAEVVEDVPIENRSPGKVVFLREGFPVVLCGEGMIKIKTLLDEKNRSLLPLMKLKTRFA